MHLPAISPHRRNLLIVTSIFTKIVVIILTIFILHSFIDTFDYQNYHLAMQNILNGLAPWAGGTSVMYPPLCIHSDDDSLRSVVGWRVYRVRSFHVDSHGNLDIITLFCIYYIGLKLYSEQTAFIAAMLYATSISMAYYSLSKFDAFPTCLAILAVLVTVYGDKTKGYLVSVAGLFL